MEVKFYLCSQLIKLTTGKATQTGNLEQISEDGCLVLLDRAIPAGAVVRLRCAYCRQGKKRCNECRFRGTVQDQEEDPLLGCFARIQLEKRAWSPESWRPQHLLQIKTTVQ